MINQKLLRILEDRFDKLQAYLFRSFDGEEDLYSFIAAVMYDKDYEDCCEIKNGVPNPQGKELRERAKQFILPVVTECGGILEREAKTYTTTTVTPSLDCWQNEPILLTSNPPKLVWKCRFCGKEITTEVSEIPKTPCSCLEENKVMSQDTSSDVDMQMRIIKGDLQYLSEKVDKLASLIEEQKIKR